MKKIIIGFIALFTLASTTYAAVNGTYKGRPIVNVVVNGQTVTSSVPGQIIDNATLLPLRAIGDALGATVDWNQQTYTATITTAQEANTGLSLAELNRIGESVGIVYAYQNEKYIGQGSAFVVDGYLISNWHVLDQGVTRFVVSFGKAEETFQVQDAAFKNEDADLIGFKISGYPSLKLSEDEIESGAKVYALGFPGNRFMITEGEVKIHLPSEGFLTHTATTDNGSSGGVLVNVEGEVVGVTDGGIDGTNANSAILASVLKAELNKIK